MATFSGRPRPGRRFSIFSVRGHPASAVLPAPASSGDPGHGWSDDPHGVIVPQMARHDLAADHRHAVGGKHTLLAGVKVVDGLDKPDAPHLKQIIGFSPRLANFCTTLSTRRRSPGSSAARRPGHIMGRFDQAAFPLRSKPEAVRYPSASSLSVPPWPIPSCCCLQSSMGCKVHTQTNWKNLHMSFSRGIAWN